MYERHFPSILTLGPRNGLGYYVVTTVYKLKNENFYVHPNNKVSIAVESRDLSRSLSLTSKFLLLGVLDPLRHRSALRKIAKDTFAQTHEIVVA